MRTIDIICPVYQEEESIGLFHERLFAVVNKLSCLSCRVLYVLDPSCDRTESILSDICLRQSGVEVLVMSRRFGHQLALIAGMDYSNSDAVVMLDSDLQHPPELIPKLVDKWMDGADIVQTIRHEGSESNALKRWVSRSFYKAFLRVGAVTLPPGAADYRLLSRRVVDIFRNEIREHNPFLRGLVSWVGYKIVYVPFTPALRQQGRSKYRASNLINLALNGLCSFSKMPLRVCIAAGLMIAILSILGAVIQIGLYLFGSVEVPGWASLFAAVTFIGGIELFFMGVIGEYTSLIFDEVKARPRYLVDRHYQQRGVEMRRDHVLDRQAAVGDDKH